ncbi:MAG: glutamine amidotransferase [Acidobacteriota bacterium]|nr:glutamine amidotransferase [Acidobacteriota bacterium]
MRFAAPFPWWMVCLLVVGAGAVAAYAYAGLLNPLSLRRRGVLMGLRFVALALLLLGLAQPVRLEPLPPADTVLPILVDRSRSMALRDADGASRLEAAVALIRDRIGPSLADRVQVEVWGFGDSVSQTDLESVRPEAGRSDVMGAIDAVRAHYADRRVAGLVVVSDGGDTGDGVGEVPPGPPVYAVGVGAPTIVRDRELLDVTLDQAAARESVVELGIAAVSHGFGTEPFEIRVLANGQPSRVIRVTPPRDGAVIREVVSVSPDPDEPTVYTVEIPLDPTEFVPENNLRTVLAAPPGRPRRLLLVEGAPGHEHAFLKRVLSADTGLAVDAAIHKGQNDRGERTFYIQGAAGGVAALAEGYPTSREALFAYDAVILANVDPSSLRPSQVEMTTAFVSERGGGLLMMGARSFDGRGLRRTTLDRLLPLESAQRADGAPRVAGGPSRPHRVSPTEDGAAHPVMRLADSVAETRRRWEVAPPFGHVVTLGRPRPGTTVLATAQDEGARDVPLVAIQRFGRGRTMVFTGEASWRWKMLAPSNDDLYDRFWRQTARWLAADAPDPVSLRSVGGRSEGDPLRFDVSVADSAFSPVLDATVRMRIRDPQGDVTEPLATPVAGQPGRYAMEVPSRGRGVYQVTATAGRDAVELGRAGLSVLVGGADLELTDPRRHDAVLQRLADATGGRFLLADDLDTLAATLGDAVADAAPTTEYDLWHTVWAFVLVLGVVSTEWVLRRQWGLR